MSNALSARIATENLPRRVQAQPPPGLREKASMHAYCMFQEPWWLEAVAPGMWKSLEVVRDGQVIARMPIVFRRKCGLRVISHPPLTPTLGPWVRLSTANTAKQIAEQRELLDRLIDQLPMWDYFRVNFDHRLTNWLPFYWRGFSQTTRYTYIIADTSDLDRVWNGIAQNARRQIRRAEKCVCVRTDLPLDRLLDLAALSYSRQGLKLPFRRELVHRIDEACAPRNARRMFFAQDADGRLHAAVYIVLDADYAYYLFGGADPQWRSSGAHKLLFWEAIRFASEMNLGFDFEGSMIELIERVFRSFGAVPVPYLQVYGARPLAKTLLLLKELMGR